ncbi:MAG: hypothetical protein RMA76_20690 [Deltaproteobacteria bacterium]|jgi:outer membrane protein W
MRLHRIIGKLTAFVFALGLATCLNSGSAEAQYKNGQIGFEGGYMFLGEKSELDSHGFLLGLRAAYKASDHWWFTARGAVSFRGEQGNSNRTVVLLHLVPVDARYYFKTDRFRPFLGVTNSFNLLFNQTIDSSVFWGPGITGGAEIRLSRDIYLGLEADAFWMFVFEGDDAPLFTTTAQLIFFL